MQQADRSDAPVEIVSYDSTWPDRFRTEALLLFEVLAPWLAGNIEHIGSTAVPGLPAKPVIDIMAPVSSLENSLPAIEAVAHLDYVYYPYRPSLMHWLCKPSPEIRTHHLHLVPATSELWRERLAFRDALRGDAGLARDYAELKTALAERHKHDRESYTDAKAVFILQALRTAG